LAVACLADVLGGALRRFAALPRRNGYELCLENQRGECVYRHERVIMPRIGIGILLLLVSVVLPRGGMAKDTASISRQTQMFSDVDNVCSDKHAPFLTAGELFTVRLLPETACFDGPAQNCIRVECISITEILDNTTGKSNHAVEIYTCDFEQLSFELSESSMIVLFLLATPYGPGVVFYETPLPLGRSEYMALGL
jgi:hypothetical protein